MVALLSGRFGFNYPRIYNKEIEMADLGEIVEDLLEKRLQDLIGGSALRYTMGSKTEQMIATAAEMYMEKNKDRIEAAIKEKMDSMVPDVTCDEYGKWKVYFREAE